jgi:dihydroorotase
MKKILIKNAQFIGFNDAENGRVHDLLIGNDGCVEKVGVDISCKEAQVIQAAGKYLSPGWCDLHTHIYYGATDVSVKVSDVGVKTGVTTLVDAGSAGEANFVGFREYISVPSKEDIYSFLNIGSIGLVACNRVSELAGLSSIDMEKSLDCVDANRDLIKGIKVRGSGVIVGEWGITPVKIAKRIAKITNLPLMVHLGEVPPLPEEILELLTPGDIITHCFHGKRGVNILEDAELFAYSQRLANQGVVLDIGHGAASFSYKVGIFGIQNGLSPTTISTDLHNRNINGPVWNLSTVMSKFLAMGMKLEDVIRASSVSPLKAIRKNVDNLLAPGARAMFTIFDLQKSKLILPDSEGTPLNLDQIINPLFTVLDSEVIECDAKVMFKIFPKPGVEHTPKYKNLGVC